MNSLTDNSFTAYVGIDWADSKHDICVQAAGDQQREFDCISHKVDQIDQWAQSLHERFVRSIKDECLDRMILFGEASLRRALREYVSHYLSERNHQGLGNRLLEPCATGNSTDGPIQCRERLGGMLNFYYREAA
jgi:hypothetical protein